MEKRRKPKKERGLVDRMFDGFKPRGYTESSLPLHYREQGLTTKITLGDSGWKPEKPEPETTWTCAPDEVNGCPIVKEPEVFVPYAMFRLWVEMAWRIDTEWLAYLTGEQTERGLEVGDMYFPAQTVGGAHVDTVDELVEIRPGTIGKVHSHAQMKAFFSAQDEAHQNWPVELVVNAKGDVAARQRVQLGCGKWSRVDSKVLLVGTQEATAKVAEVKAAIAAGEKWELEHKPTYGNYQSKVTAQVADDVPVHLAALEDWMHE